jgi:mannan endo-1,4-beta-mannosidase
MPNGIHFFTDYSQLIDQTEDLAYGPVKGKEDTNYRATNLLKASTDVFAFAACTGEVFMQDAGNGFATIVIKPKSSIGFNGSKIKYFVYKGLKMSSIADTGKKQIIAINITTNAGIPTSKLVEKFHINAKAAIAELQVKNPGFNAIPEEFAFNLSGLQFTDKTHDNYVNIEYFFNKKENTTTFTPLSISQGETIGYFDKDNIGFEIIYGDCDVTLGDLRNKEKIVIADALPKKDIDKIKNIYKREQILNYVDACAFYGNFASANSNDDFIQIGLNKDIRLKPTEFKTRVIDKFFTNNDLYIDIRNQHKNSFNLYLNNNNVKISIYAKQNTATAFKEIKTSISYETNNWPLLKIKSFSSILGLTTLDTYLCINIKLTFEGANASYKDKPYIYLVSNDLKLDETKKVITDRKTTNEINNLKVIETKDDPPKYTIDLPNNFTRTVNSSIVPTLIGLSCYFKQPVSLTGEFPSNYFLDNYFSVPYVLKDGKYNWGFYELPNAKTIIKCSNEECFTLSSPTTYKNDYLTFKGFAKDTKGMYFYVIAKTQSIAANDADKDFFEFLDENIKIKNIDFIQKKILIGGTPHFTCVCSTTANASELINMHQNVDYLQIVAITTQQQATLFAQVANIGLDKNAPLRFCLKHKELAVADNSINFNKYELCISGYNPSEQIEQISTGIYFYKQENANERIFISEEYCNKNLKPRSKEAEKLFNNLLVIQDKKLTILGHHDTLAYGRINEIETWKSEESRPWKSDISNILKPTQLPGLMGWDFGSIELGDGSVLMNNVRKNSIKDWVIKTSNSGIIHTFCWHMNHPDGTNSWGKSKIATILQDGHKHNSTFKSWIKKAAAFFKSLNNGHTTIPVILRPFHEVTSNNQFFWWNDINQSSDYILLWKLLRTELEANGVFNVLYAYCVNDYFTEATINSFYPGREYVDIICFDSYLRKYETAINFKKRQIAQCNIISKIKSDANYSSKIFAISEFGANDLHYGIPNQPLTEYLSDGSSYNDNGAEDLGSKIDFFSDILNSMLNITNFCYVMLWRNDSGVIKNPKMKDDNDYYVPFEYIPVSNINKPMAFFKQAQIDYIKSVEYELDQFCKEENNIGNKPQIILSKRMSLSNIYSIGFDASKLRK